MVAARSLCPPPASGRRRIVQDTGCIRWRRLGGGLHGIQSAAASRVLLLLDDGGGRARAARHLVNIRIAASPRRHPCSHVTSLTSGAATFSACMSRLHARRRWMAKSQTLEALYDAAASRAATMPVPPCSPTSRRGASRHSSSSCIGEASCGTTRWLNAATASDGLGEVGGEASCLARNCRARQATQTAFMPENCSSCLSDAAERVDKMVEGGAWPASCS